MTRKRSKKRRSQAEPISGCLTEPLREERLFAASGVGCSISTGWRRLRLGKIRLEKTTVNRDNVLFLVIGTLVGFIAGFVMHEVMAARQPAPRRPDSAEAAATTSGAASGSPAAPTGRPAGMEAVQRLRAHVAENPDDAPAVRQLANLNYDIRNWQRAAELYEQYLGLVPEDAGVMTDLGAVYRFLGRHQEALVQFRGARQRDPSHWQALYNEVLVLAFDLGELEAADAAIKELSRLQPDNSDISQLAAELQKRSDG